ncbi:conserved exported hypothetical protein [Gammaproteobacteria bacterium]
MTRKYLISIIIIAIATAYADDNDETYINVSLLPIYQQECGSCHIAYPAGMLPSISWQQIMTSLQKHFGSDASLDPTIISKISSWLTTNASKKINTPPENRITRTKWFIHEHQEINNSVWQRLDIRNASNCSACHTKATQGQYGK